jgi:hypothetical protein
MNESEKQFFFTHAASITSGRAKNQISLGTKVNALLVAGAVSVAIQGFPQKADAAVYMNIVEPIHNYANGVRPFNLSVENLAPAGEDYNMIVFNIPGFSSPSDIYNISVGNDFANWSYSFSQGSDGLYTLSITAQPGGDPLEGDSDGIPDGGPIGSVHFESHYALVQTNAATAWAYGLGSGNSIPFAPVLVVLPLPDVRPVLSGLEVTNATASLTATNLAPGNGYTLERSADLALWTNVLTFAATNSAQPLTIPATNTPAHFYRLRSP